ncbi:Signal transduction histidine kinase [Flavobacterium micromati]|uniref:histidine kinase n=1 Tax=Flavobacterium micromati TaxID=229205 RepID=A0A1M5FTB9_9FLAO|nr:response regulator [Flavobacterium micromati]MCL6460899.1 response regulator [Flavobacterium micromati]SHF94659.1 Signal transduction histidine kinase [Flavobacterium micromati]
MDDQKSYIPIKIFSSYLVLVLLFGAAGWFLYSENKSFSKTEQRFTEKNSSILRVSTILSDLYNTESLARVAIQTDSDEDFTIYVAKTKKLKIDIDSLKAVVSTQYQRKLLDSVQLLLSKKTKNIRQLKFIKNKNADENAVRNAINDLTKMQSSMRKIQMEDFVKNPASMGDYERNVLKKYVGYLNQNIPDDSSNTLTKEESDSIVSVSKMLLNDVKRETENKKKLLTAEENKLLKNELLISEQLRKVFGIIEREIIVNTTTSYLEREKSLEKTNKIVTIVAAIGLFLTLFFLILILNDFSKTQLYKQQLESANLQTKKLLVNREQLISTVSHDLKTPLSTIIGYTELLSNSELTKKQLHFTKSIKGSSSYISKLVQDLLDFTQIEAGKVSVEKIPFLLPEIIKEIATNVQSIYLQKPIKLRIEIDEMLQQRIISDPFRLRQILSNIIGNAFKFTEQGFIAIKANLNLQTSFVIILIEDSGIGIEEKNQQLVFEEFAQATEKIEKKFGGTGLGLTISKKMTAILGGSLSLKSEIGKGSVFEIQFPLLFAETLPNLNKIAPLHKKEYTAIVIDDDHSLLQLTTEVLRQNNFVVEAFNNALDALSWIEKNPFDFIITDIQMPIMDGFSFLKELLSNPVTNYKNQPIIAVTGRNDLDFEDYINAGFTTYIKKPFTPKTLLNSINAVLNISTVAKKFEAEIIPLKHNESYSLEDLKSFLPDDQTALKEILTSFTTDSLENLTILEQALIDSDFEKIKIISHKMNPMFKQIKAEEISIILDQLELKDVDLEDLNSLISRLKNKITALFLLLEKEYD